MINEPVAISKDGFQETWLDVVRLLVGSQWETRNLVVHIRDTRLLDQSLHRRMSDFAEQLELRSPRDVAYTIFPHGLYRKGRDAAAVFHAYNRKNGMYARLHKLTNDWGNYFRRMTHYRGKDGVVVNQLGSIITAIRDRSNLSRAAYTMVIQHPGGETIRPLGGPCLNYLAVQAEPDPFTIGLLAVYRNHDFLERAYGNYWGLCNLTAFLAQEVGAAPGPLTCVSSRAYVEGNKVALRDFVGSI